MKSISRIGKVARLSHSIREQLNLRLLDHEPAKSILPWLNSLPEVKAILAADFNNRPISKQNLSEWKQGGHRDWLLQYHASQFLQFLPSHSSSSSLPPQPKSHDATQHATRHTVPPSPTVADSDSSAFCVPHSSLTAKLLLWTQLQYTTMARFIDSESDPQRKWNALRQFANDISRLRRSTLADDYLQIQRDWLALSQSNSTEKKELEFCQWIKRPDIAQSIKNKKRGLTRELLRKIEEEDLYLLGPDNPSLDEHIAQVRIAKELMARRKAKEAEAKRQPGDPAPEPPRINLRDTTFEELFPTLPEKPLTETYPQLDPDNPDRDKPQSRNADLPLGDNFPVHSIATLDTSAQPEEGSAARAASGDANPATDEEASDGVPPLPVRREEGQPALRSPFDEGEGEGQETIHPLPADDQNTIQSDHQNESSDSSCQSDPVKPSPTKSNQSLPSQQIPMFQVLTTDY